MSLKKYEFKKKKQANSNKSPKSELIFQTSDS